MSSKDKDKDKDVIKHVLLCALACRYLLVARYVVDLLAST